MILEAVYCNSEVTNEIHCETGRADLLPLRKHDEIPAPATFDEFLIINNKTNSEKLYAAKKVLYKVGGDFLILGNPVFDIDSNPNVFVKGTKSPVHITMDFPIAIDNEFKSIDVLIAPSRVDYERNEYLIYDDGIYEILKTKKENQPTKYRLEKCCSFSHFYENNKLRQDFFNLA